MKDRNGIYRRNPQKSIFPLKKVDFSAFCGYHVKERQKALHSEREYFLFLKKEKRDFYAFGI